MTAQRTPRTSSQPYQLDPRPALEPLPSRAPATHGEGRGGERENPSLPDPAVVLSLTPSAQRLARWLERELHATGARAMIRRYGTRAILAALHDGIVVRTNWGHAIRPELHSPGGFLRWLLAQQEVQQSR
jgi:hypothetical protein